MKFAIITSAAALLASPLALPTDITCGPPPRGRESIDYQGGTVENFAAYPPPAGGWESVNYPEGTGVKSPSCRSPFFFTSAYSVVAVGSEIRNGMTPALGPKDAVSYFNSGTNSNTDTIYYVRLIYASILQNILTSSPEHPLLNVAGAYQSDARTAIHIHEAARGASGPPRLAFPNLVRVGYGKTKVSVGCFTGPFTTGLNGPNG
jgi:hypothetical protein